MYLEVRNKLKIECAVLPWLREVDFHRFFGFPSAYAEQ